MWCSARCLISVCTCISHVYICKLGPSNLPMQLCAHMLEARLIYLHSASFCYQLTKQLLSGELRKYCLPRGDGEDAGEPHRDEWSLHSKKDNHCQTRSPVRPGQVTIDVSAGIRIWAHIQIQSRWNEMSLQPVCERTLTVLRQASNMYRTRQP